MADSDHSMSFGCVTRRLALGGLFVAGVGRAFGASRATAATDVMPPPAPDPAVAVWRDWNAAYEQAMWLCDRLQELEAAVGERVDALWTVVRVPGGEEIIVCSKAALDRIVGERTDMAEIRAKAEADLDARQAHFEMVATEIGYFEGLRAEQAGFARVEALLEALSGTPAASLSGVVGKLDAVLRNGANWEDRSAFPWPQIRSAREDLMRIGHQLTPHAFFPGRVDCEACLSPTLPDNSPSGLIACGFTAEPVKVKAGWRQGLDRRFQHRGSRHPASA